MSLIKTPTIVAKVLIINDQGQGLLVTRSETDGNRAGEADLPGGAVDEGETWQEGAVREVMEETGLVVHEDELALTRVHTAMRKGINVIRPFYVTHVFSGDIQLSHEHSAYEWIKVEDMPSRFLSPGWGDSVQYAVDNNLL